MNTKSVSLSIRRVVLMQLNHSGAFDPLRLGGVEFMSEGVEVGLRETGVCILS